VLLIAECLDDCNLRKLHNEAIELGMSPLVELYDPANLSRVFDAGATLIGVNNRDLRTFEVDLQHTIRMREKIPDQCVLVGESGIHSREDALLLEKAASTPCSLASISCRSPTSVRRFVPCLAARRLRLQPAIIPITAPAWQPSRPET